MAIINLVGTSTSGMLYDDFVELKNLVYAGGNTPGTTSPLVTKTGTEALTNKTITGSTLTSTTVNSGTISGGTMSSAIITGGTLSNVAFATPAAFVYYDTGNSGTTKTIDWNNGAFQKTTMTGNCTYTFTAPTGATGMCIRLQLNVKQDTTGSRVATWPANVQWGGSTAPTLTTTGGRADIIAFVYDNTNYAGSCTNNFGI